MAPGGVMPSQPGSFSGANFSGTLPVLLTMIWYSTVSPSSAVSSETVKNGSPAIRCCFSIV